MTTLGLEKAGALIAILLASQGWARWRGARIAQVQAKRPLFDGVALETALARCERNGGSPVSEQLGTYLRGHNRAGDASELTAGLVAIALGLNSSDHAVLIRCLTALQASPDSGLAGVAASALALISPPSALSPRNAESAK